MSIKAFDEYTDRFIAEAMAEENVFKSSRLHDPLEGSDDWKEAGYPTFVDGSDAYANKGFIVALQHVPSGRNVYFKAFISAYNETYSSDWNSEVVYGRADPIMLFKNTTRTVNLTLQVPASTKSEAYENLSRIGTLSKFLYPMYTDVNDASTIAQSPLVRLKVMNLLTNQKIESKETYEEFTTDTWQGMPFASNGILGAITSLNINHNLDNDEAGVIEIPGGAILPKLIEIALDFAIIHEHALGWDATEGFSEEGWPYGLDLAGSKPNSAAEIAEEQAEEATVYNEAVEAEKAEERGEEEPNDSLRANAAAKMKNALDWTGSSLSAAREFAGEAASRGSARAAGAVRAAALRQSSRNSRRTQRRADRAAPEEEVLSLRDRPDLPPLDEAGLTEEEANDLL